MTLVLQAIWESLNHLAMFFGWCVLLIMVIGLIALGPVNLHRRLRDYFDRKFLWAEVEKARREWEIDDYPKSAEYVHRSGDAA